MNRNNAQQDADYIEHSMKALGFTVTKKVGRITLQEARDAISEMVDEKRQEDKDMFSICIMTHGTEQKGEVLRFSDNQHVYFGSGVHPSADFFIF